MIVQELIKLLENNKNSALHIMLPEGNFVPAHFHVTEIGYVKKVFIDCGGTRRQSNSCLLQVWTAHDIDHRLESDKLLKIFKLAEVESDLLIEIEYGEYVASQYKLDDVEVTPKGLLFVLSGKQTNCLAPDKCGVGCC